MKTKNQQIYLIKYGELGLKGKNKAFFLGKLIANIKSAVEVAGLSFVRLENKRDRIVAVFDAGVSHEHAVACLQKVFGIKYFVKADVLEAQTDDILKYAQEVFARWKKEGVQKVSLNINRADKKFPLTSPELSAEIGGVASQMGLKIDFADGEKTLFVDVAESGAYCYAEKIAGAGGLPSGTEGKALCLFSGGIDSPVAAHALMRRGMRVDFLHIHPFADNAQVVGTKIEELAQVLKCYQYRARIFLVPYMIFEEATMGKIPQRFEMPFFKHVILALADALAKRNKYKALITGDALGQVASQTIDNINAVSLNIKTPILRPLIGADKEEIVSRAEEIGTYDVSIAPYRDCCSLVAQGPATNTKEHDMCEIFEKVDVNALVKKMIDEMSVMDL